MKQIILLIIMSCFCLLPIAFALNISGGNTITQDFSIGTAAISPLPADWKVDKNTTVRTLGTYSAAVTATERTVGNNMGTTAANGIYNYAAGDPTTATDRAVGWVSSSTATKSGNLYIMLVNNGVSTIGTFTISFDVEKYRKGTNAAGFTIQMYTSPDGITWTSAGTDFAVNFPGADADNTGYASAPGATTSISLMSLPQPLVASDTLFLAWNYSVTTGSTTSNAQALGIDNVVITANTSGPTQPILTTTAITNVTPSTASSGGNIISDGGSNISARGVCWNTTGTPTIANAISTNGTGPGSFVSTLINLTPSTLYYVRAYATNDLGTGYGNELSFTTSGVNPPPAPVAIDATNITPTSFNANWEVVTDAVDYRLDVSTSDTFSSYVTGYQDLTVTGSTQAIIGLTASTTYYYRVRAVNTIGTSVNSNTITAITANIPVIPDPPVATAATNVAASGFTATWNASTGATSYRLDVSISNLFGTFVTGYENLAVSGLSQTVSGLSPSTTYYYRVRAFNDAGTSTNSNTISILTTDSGAIILTEGFEGASTTTPPVGWALSSPGSYILTNVANAHGGTNYAGFNLLSGWVRTPALDNPLDITFWGRASGSTSNFTITLQSSTDTAEWTDIVSYAANGTDTGEITVAYTQKVASLNLTGSYYLRWFVTARTSGSFYLDDVVVSSGIVPNPPAIPVATAASSISSTGFTANWITATNATSYRLDISTSETFSSFVTGYNDLMVSGLSQAVTGLDTETNYYYRVRGFNTIGTSGNSNVINVFTTSTTVIPNPPVATTGTDITALSFTANWNASPTATNYRLDVSTSNTFSTYVTGYQDLAVSGLSQSIIGLSALTNYYYRIRAVNDAGTSTNSNIISVITSNTDPYNGYYNPVVGLTGNALKSGLTTLISTNTYNSYDGARVIMFQQLDNHNGIVRCVYTGQDFAIAPDYSGQTSPNTEHTYAQSWFTASASIEKADLHHLFVTESTVNSSRGNLPFGKVAVQTTSYASFNGYVSKRGTDQLNQTVFEPADQHKGDCARALLYFNVRYNETLTIDGVDMLPACLQWNYLDPPDAAEVTRNTMIQTTLSNRNPFVDHPEYVTSIYVGTTNNTMLNFQPTSSSVLENAGTVHLFVQIQNPNVFASSATVVLKSGDPSHIGNYAPVTITFPSNSTTAQQVDINVTDDNVVDGDETFVFEIQNGQGGYYTIPGLQNDYVLTVNDNESSIPVPTALSAIQTSNTSFVAHWLPANGISSYALDVANDSAFSSILTGYNNQVVNDTTFFVINLEIGHTYYYRVRSILNTEQSANSNVISIILTGNQDPEAVITNTAINSIYPNPFNPETTIKYSLSKPGFVKMEIYNVKGQKVKTLVSQNQGVGNYSLTWNGKNDQNKTLGSGIYYVKMDSGNHSKVRKVVLLK